MTTFSKTAVEPISVNITNAYYTGAVEQVWQT